MIEKIKENKDKIFVFVMFLLVFLHLLSTILVKEINNLDELWNYNIARNITKGLVPYKDISMITTPLVYMIEAIVLKIFSNELIVFRLMNVVLLTSILYMTYKVINSLVKSKINSLIITLPLLAILKNDLFLDYNFFTVFLSLLIIYLELQKIDKKNLKNDSIIGLLGGLAFCTKQTIGIIICVGVILPTLICSIRDKSFKAFWARIVGILIPIIILLVYLLITQSFNSFISYVFLSINTFENNISYTNLIKHNDLLIRILAVLLPVCTIANIVFITMYKNKENLKYIKIKSLFLYSLTLVLIEYPIADRIHFILANWMMIILLLIEGYYSIQKLYRKFDNRIKRLGVVTIKAFIILYFITITTTVIINKTKEYAIGNKNSELKYYKNLILSDYIVKLYNDTIIVEENYENQGKEVIILDSNAALVHIPMDKYRKNYDMFNKGNFGKDGEEGLINQIENEKSNNVYLIRNDKYPKNWQHPSKVTDFVKSNFAKSGEVGIYDIYE